MAADEASNLDSSGHGISTGKTSQSRRTILSHVPTTAVTLRISEPENGKSIIRSLYGLGREIMEPIAAPRCTFEMLNEKRRAIKQDIGETITLTHIPGVSDTIEFRLRSGAAISSGQ